MKIISGASLELALLRFLSISDSSSMSVTYPSSEISLSTGEATDQTPQYTNVSSFTIEPALPDGLSLDASSGSIGGTPSTTQSRTEYTVTGNNASGESVSVQLFITISTSSITLSYSSSSYTYSVGNSVSIIPTVGGTIASCTASPSLPSGLAIGSDNCSISGTPTASSTSTGYTITASNSSSSSSASIHLTIDSTSIAISYSAPSYSYSVGNSVSIAASTSGTITSCSSSPSLPSGLSIDASTCNISGTASSANASTSYTVTASNSVTSTTTTFTMEIDQLWVQDAYVKASNTGAYDRFGRAVAISGDYAVVGADGEDNYSTSIVNTDNASITDGGTSSSAGAAYIFKRDSSTGIWTQDAYLKAANADQDDSFAYSLAISGDYIIVGAYGESNSTRTIINTDNAVSTDNNSASGSGAAYIFKRDSSTGNWSQDAYLKAANAGGTDNFGHSVSISGAYAIVGANLEDSTATSIDNTDDPSMTDIGGASSSGAAFIYKRDTSSGNWQQDAYLKAPNTGSNDQFGFSVAINGDYAIVGAYFEDNNVTSIINTDNPTITESGTINDSGAAYIFKRDSSTGDWSLDAYLKASNAGSGDQFGCSVAVSGDFAIVGAYSEGNDSTSINNTDNVSIVDSGTASGSGAAYIFRRDSSTGDWLQDAYLKASNAASNDIFGISVAMYGDYAVVGAYLEDNSSTSINNTDNTSINDLGTAASAGAVYVFKRSSSSGEWLQDAYLKASNTGAGDNFAVGLAISGSYIVVGAELEDNSSTSINNTDSASITEGGTADDSGAAYIFKL